MTKTGQLSTEGMTVNINVPNSVSDPKSGKINNKKIETATIFARK